jgi:murein DD-endopeptidase MepM/ murein hydrolase activator NlpD
MSEGTEHVPAMLSTFSAGIQPTKQSPAWSMPVRANTPVSGSFGEVGRYWPGGHAGIDFNGTQGDPIFAATDGRVTFASFHSGGYGNLIFVMRGDGTQTRYAHLHRIQVRVGDRVKAGQRIGRMGSSGQATGTHLHFEVRVGPGLTPTHPQSLWSGRRPGVARTPPAWSCAKYGGCR